MSLTQIWMLCIILCMVFFIVLTLVWGRGNDGTQQGQSPADGSDEKKQE